MQGKVQEEIERADVTRMLSKLSAAPGEQQHAYVALRTMLNWCVASGFLENSPMPRVRQKTTSRDRVLSDEELAAVGGEFLRAPPGGEVPDGCEVLGVGRVDRDDSGDSVRDVDHVTVDDDLADRIPRQPDVAHFDRKIRIGEGMGDEAVRLVE